MNGPVRTTTTMKRKRRLDGVLPDLHKGDALTLQAMEPRQHSPAATAFYQASLIKELDEKGIGRRRPMRRSYQHPRPRICLPERERNWCRPTWVS